MRIFVLFFKFTAGRSPCVATISGPQAVHSLYSPLATRSLDVIPVVGKPSILWSAWLQTLNIVLTGYCHQPLFSFRRVIFGTRHTPPITAQICTVSDVLNRKYLELTGLETLQPRRRRNVDPISSDSCGCVKRLIVTDSCTPHLVASDCGKRGQRQF